MTLAAEQVQWKWMGWRSCKAFRGSLVPSSLPKSFVL